MRTVVWTDVFQCIILFVGLIVILIIGIMKAGGVTNMLQIAEAGGRIKFNELSLDPRVRHTVWGVIIGGFFNWLPNCCNQACVQRICSMKSVRDAKISSLINVPLVLLYGVVLVATGVLLFAYFSIEECDPLVIGTIDNANQLVPYLVMRVFKQVPGLSGLFIAVLFSGALSTLSSGINALSANTIHDVLANVLHGATERRKTFIAKTVVLVYGIIAVTGGYFAKGISGPVTQIAWAISGGAGGPMTGVLFLGALFPQANWIGALCGGISGFIINMWVAVGQLVYGNKAPPSPPVPTTGCVTPDGLFSNETMHISVTETTPQAVTRTAGHLPIYDMSYIYLGLLGFVVSIIVGLIVSVISRKYDDNTTEPEYILPQLRRFWKVGYRAATTNSESNNDILQPLDTHL